MILSDHHHLFIFFFISCCFQSFCVNLISAQNYTQFNVGVVLDMDSPVGKVGWSCISMALHDFYASHTNYSTRLVLYQKNSSGNIVGATFAALDLLRNAKVEAIIGPQKSTQADFVMNLGDKAHIPIISFSATSPSLSLQTPYFIRTAQNDSAQVKPIAAIIKAFKWREIALIYEDTEYGHGVIPYLVDAFQDIEARVTYRSVISISASDYEMSQELNKLKNLYNRVFVVHMTHSLSIRFLPLVKEAGMLSDGYAWIVTDGITDLVDFMDSNVVASMQGMLGVRPYIPRSKALYNIKIRWIKKFRQENPDFDRPELNVYGLWAYDTVWALAMAVESVGVTTLATNKSTIAFNSTDFGSITTSRIGEKLIQKISNMTFQGLSGDFKLTNGQLQSSIFQIINVIDRRERKVGFWSPEHGISRDLNATKAYTTSFRGIIWPGETTDVPKGWVIPTSGKKLKIGVPYTGFTYFVKVDNDTSTNKTIIQGYSIDIFEAVIKSLPYALPYEFEPINISNGVRSYSYDDMIQKVFHQELDAVVGTTTITANRSKYADFTLPYTDGGVSMLVSLKSVGQKSPWIFLSPLTKELWLTTLAFFILTGLVVWVLEHRINEAFRGPVSQSLGKVLWFPLSTLVFAHRERVVSNLAQFVVMIWVFVMLILNSTYTASLSSMLTVERLQPVVTSIQELIENGDNVGYQQGSFIRDMLIGMKFEESKIKSFNSFEECDNALLIGSQKGGISAFFDVTPYMNDFITKYCDKFTIVGPIYKTEGFGFVFPKGSPLVGDVSRAILNITEGHKSVEIDRAWYGFQTPCPNRGKNDMSSSSLSLYNFRGLFIMTGTVSLFALLVFLATFVYKHRYILTSNNNSNNTFWVRLQTMFRQFDEKDLSSYPFKRKEVVIFANRDQSVEVRDMEAIPSFGSCDTSASPSPIRNRISSDHGASTESLAVEEMVEINLR